MSLTANITYLRRTFSVITLSLLTQLPAHAEDNDVRPRARDIGLVVGTMNTGKHNALLKATTVEGRGNRFEAIPIDKTIKILKEYNALNWDKMLPPGNQTVR